MWTSRDIPHFMYLVTVNRFPSPIAVQYSLTSRETTTHDVCQFGGSSFNLVRPQNYIFYHASTHSQIKYF